MLLLFQTLQHNIFQNLQHIFAGHIHFTKEGRIRETLGRVEYTLDRKSVV